MMANNYISFLGTNPYLECIYYEPDNQLNAHKCRFVQEATLLFNCKTWSQSDRVIIFTTQEAYQKNWLNNNNEANLPGLKDCIDSLSLEASVSQIDIPQGINESEIWTIFKKMFDELNPDDAVIFDITHAFRTIPLLAIVVLNYARIMKNVHLKGIYYGAFETLGSIQDVKAMPPDRRRVPVLDFTSLNQLLEWTTAIEHYLKSGNADELGQLTEFQARNMLSKSKGKDRFLHSFRKLGESLQTLSLDIATVRGLEITPDVQRIKYNIDECMNLNFIEPFTPVLSRIQHQMEKFEDNPSKDYNVKDGIQAARFCLSHHMIQQAFTITVETMISYFLEQIGENPVDFNNKRTMDIRRLVNQTARQFVEGNDSSDQWGELPGKYPDVFQNLLACFKKQKDLIKKYTDINRIRNDINHAGINNNPIKSKGFEKKLSEFLTII